MTSYETIMVIIAILNLLIAVYKINRKYSKPPVN